MSDKIRDAVQHLVVDALTAADLVRSGHRSKALSDRLSQHCSVLSKMLAAAPAAPVAQEPVAWVLMHNGDVAYDRDEVIICNVPGDCLDESYEWRAVYAAPPAAEQADSVKVSRELLRRALQDCMFLPLEETVRRNTDRNAALRALRALLA